MKLLMDFGNSRCKCVLVDEHGWQQVNVLSYQAETPAQSIDTILQTISYQEVTDIHVVSVLGASFEMELTNKIKNLAGIEVNFHTTQLAKFGVSLSNTDTSSYGSDRYAALVAAHHDAHGAKIIVDCGTATTVDSLDEQGNHLGGLIIPGAHLMCAVLASKASGISLSKTQRSAKLFNMNTHDAVYSGSIFSLRHGLLGIINEVKQSISNDVSVYITGGESALLNFSSTEFLMRPDLVLEGINIMQG